jgi:hypothetical protein
MEGNSMMKRGTAFKVMLSGATAIGVLVATAATASAAPAPATPTTPTVSAVSAGSTARQAAPATRTFGWCDSISPTNWTDPETVSSVTLPDGAVIQLRYSPSARCVWARMLNGHVGDQVCIAYASGSDSSCVFLGVSDEPSVYTAELDDAGVTADATGTTFEGSKNPVASVQTGSY